MKIYFRFGIKIFFLSLFINCFQTTYPADETANTDVRALSLGQVKALSQELLNPSFLSFIEQKQFGISVYNRFAMKELSTQSLYGLIPNRFIDTGFKFSAYGYEDYQLLQGQISLAKKISPTFSIGTNLIYLNVNSVLDDKIRNYLMADVGVFWRINDSFDWAFTTENLLYTQNFCRTLFYTGINYHLSSICHVLLETGADFRNEFHISAGIEYEIAEQFAVRGGFRNNPQTPSLGFAYTLNQWKVDAGFLLHPVLGVSSAISINYFF
ncbi:hypothetical protein FACS189420_2090 [Bacteroidia bacterium]|nr:hypothetical protein FACS18947_1380 [Bacteroidia bacterium]GHV70546.1 hypothetical protein FACS189420_2090 [Bacteroidia bacterium]